VNVEDARGKKAGDDANKDEVAHNAGLDDGAMRLSLRAATGTSITKPFMRAKCRIETSRNNQNGTVMR